MNEASAPMGYTSQIFTPKVEAIPLSKIVGYLYISPSNS